MTTGGQVWVSSTEVSENEAEAGKVLLFNKIGIVTV